MGQLKRRRRGARDGAMRASKASAPLLQLTFVLIAVLEIGWCYLNYLAFSLLHVNYNLLMTRYSWID